MLRGPQAPGGWRSSRNSSSHALPPAAAAKERVTTVGAHIKDVEVSGAEAVAALPKVVSIAVQQEAAGQ